MGQDIRKFMNLMESPFDDVISSIELVEGAEEFMKEQVAEYQQYVNDGRSIPSAPDSTKFLAKQSGMIEYAPKTQVPGGSYGFSRFFQTFVKIGGTVDYKIKQEMADEFKNWYDSITASPNSTVFITSDGYKVFFDTVEGTNWGGYGLVFTKNK
jgi:hypothetical protein